MTGERSQLRIAYLSDNGLELDVRAQKILTCLTERHANVQSFSLRRRGDAALNPDLVPGVSLHGIQRTLSKGQAQAQMAGLPPWLAPRRIQLAARVLGLPVILAGGATALGLVAGWVFPLLALPLIAMLAIRYWVDNRMARLRTMTGFSPKAKTEVPLFDAWAAHTKQSRALLDGVEAAIARDGPFDVIHAQELIGLEAGAELKRRHGGILIWEAAELYEDMADPDPGQSAVARRVIAGAAPLVDGMTTVNDSLAEYYHATYPDLPGPVVVMNATPRMQAPEDDGRLRAATGFGPEDRILLFQGGLTINRGLPALIDAAQHFPPGWKLAVLGYGELGPELTARADAINAGTNAPRIAMLPPVPSHELAAWTVGADLGIIPYENVAGNHWFCAPNKLWEYPAAGLPFLAPRLHFIERLVDKYGTGILFDAEFDADTIARAVASVDDAALARARDAIPRFLDEMSWEQFTPRIHALYDAVLSDPAGSASKRS